MIDTNQLIHQFFDTIQINDNNFLNELTSFEIERELDMPKKMQRNDLTYG